jgi:hypothetical protein
VTQSAIEIAAARPSSRLPAEGVTSLIERAVGETLLLKDLRTFFDRTSGTTTDHWVYRVNPRHPIAAEILADSDR